mgnify:FL=1
MCNAIVAAIDIKIDAAKQQILQAAIRAKRSHKLNVDSDVARLKSWRYEGPTLVATASVKGWVDRDMYDEHPGLAYFRTTTGMDVELGLLTLDQAKAAMTVAFLERAWHGEWFDRARRSDDDGLATDVSGLLLKDNLGHVVAEARVDCDCSDPQEAVVWLASTAMTDRESDCELAKAKELESDASEEARWDNFDSANSLRGQAASLRRRVEITANVNRLAA